MNLYAILGALSLITSVLLTFIILIQNSKGGGLSSTFGASNINSMIGTRRAAQDVEKFTWYLGFGLFGVAFLANAFLPKQVISEESIQVKEVYSPGTPPAQTAPAAPAGGGQPTQ